MPISYVQRQEYIYITLYYPDACFFEGYKTFKDLCRMVAANIKTEKWMRFVRLHLNLDKDEIDSVRLQYCVITTEQLKQIQYWIER